MYAQLNSRPVALVTNQSQRICPCIQRRFHANVQVQRIAISSQMSTCGSHTLTLPQRHVSVNNWRPRQEAQAFREGARHRWHLAEDCPFRSLRDKALRRSSPERCAWSEQHPVQHRCDARNCNWYLPLQCIISKTPYLLCTFNDNTSPGRRRFCSFLQWRR